MDQQLVPTDLGYEPAEEGGIFVHLERLGERWRWRWRRCDSNYYDQVANDDTGTGRIMLCSMGSVWWIGLVWAVDMLCALYMQRDQSVLFAVSVS